MKKTVTRILSFLLCAATAFSVVGCGDKDSSSSSDGSTGTKKYVENPETRPVVFSTDPVDKNFNPFFSTSAPDSRITSDTQIGMLTTANVDGKDVIVAGKEYPTVALDYQVTEKKDPQGKTYTDYEFIIKKGIKFSDGVDLTIKDVLFNLYVYLDPQYMGSSTIYSTKIQGLNAYRTQSESVTDDSDLGALESVFETNANARMIRLTNYLSAKNDSERPPLTEEITSDIKSLKELFKKEVTSDWATAASALESYKEYRFTEAWEVYYYTEGLIVELWDKVEKDGAIVYEKQKDENGKFYTTLDEVDGKENMSYLRTEMTAAVADSEWRAKAQADGCQTQTEIDEWIKKEYAIQTVYDSLTGSNSGLNDIVKYWATGDELREQFIADEKTKHFEESKKDGELLFKTITGITTGKTTTDFKGNALSSEHDVLKIRINGVDPKAIYNFAFAVAPMHYYSGEYKGVDYVATANGVDSFGVAFGEKEFFDNVLQAPEKSGLPVGAGVYMASNASGNKNEVNKDTFCNNNWIYFERNPYFETVDGEGNTDITNAKIKYMRYKVVGSNMIITALTTKEIDIGYPNATPTNQEKIGDIAHLGYKDYVANGYGYVGINPKYVPSMEIRQAIMKAMNTSLTVSMYYTEKLASVIYRPMSLTSWAYPKENNKPIGEYEKVAFTTELDTIRALVKAAGYTYDNNKDGVMENQSGDTLEYTFTIAGDTQDHPAYAMFEDAAQTLNQCGFKITIKTDSQALKKLATGGLQIWAAAWTSTIDPDMYQVYHKDSTATSVKNWGYDAIFKDSDTYYREQEIINELSEKIEEARETTNQTQRTGIYAQCLDLIMDLCVELPTYQRRDMIAYNKDLIDTGTFYQGEATANTGVIDKLWELNYAYTYEN